MTKGDSPLRIALLAPRSGYILRGVETWSYELKQRSEGNIRVFSLVETAWTTRVRGLTRLDRGYRPYLRLVRLGDRFGLGHLGRRLPWFEIFGPWDLPRAPRRGLP